MLPFLKTKRQSSGISMEYRNPDATDSQKVDSDTHMHDDAALEAAASDMLQAHSQGDKKGLAAAFRAAFQILESEPHAENSEQISDLEE